MTKGAVGGVHDRGGLNQRRSSSYLIGRILDVSVGAAFSRDQCRASFETSSSGLVSPHPEWLGVSVGSLDGALAIMRVIFRACM